MVLEFSFNQRKNPLPLIILNSNLKIFFLNLKQFFFSCLLHARTRVSRNGSLHLIRISSDGEEKSYSVIAFKNLQAVTKFANYFYFCSYTQ